MNKQPTFVEDGVAVYHEAIFDELVVLPFGPPLLFSFCEFNAPVRASARRRIHYEQCRLRYGVQITD